MRQVREHVTKLGAKGYWDQFSSSPDFVVLFLPTEAIFLGALEQDAQLIEFGVKERVLIASPLTLIALLRAAALGWRQERLTINAEEISRLGRELYDRARTFADKFDAVGSRLDSAVKAYNDAVGSYDTRVMVSMRRFKELGAATGDDIPPVAPVDSAARPLQSASQQDLLDAAIIDGEVEESASSRSWLRRVSETRPGGTGFMRSMLMVAVAALAVAPMPLTGQTHRQAGGDVALGQAAVSACGHPEPGEARSRSRRSGEELAPPTRRIPRRSSGSAAGRRICGAFRMRSRRSPRGWRCIPTTRSSIGIAGIAI